jgi:putative hydrolase of the HAD superfamily
MHSLSDTVFVFDLDDTLYSERSYELSGITAAWYKLSELNPDISTTIPLELLIKQREQWVDLILHIEPKNFTLSRDLLLEIYRSHFPSIELYDDSCELLSFLVENKAKLAMITDGRSLSQRQKLKALNIEHLFKPIQISEETGYPKPNSESYLAIEKVYPNHQYLYFGDNPKKDFVTPNKLGWSTYGLKDRGNNVHPQHNHASERFYMPQIWLNKLSELIPRIIQ